MAIEMTTKADLLARTRAGHAEWTALLASVPAARLAEAGADGAGELSVHDLIAHVAYWERRAADLLEAAAARRADPPRDGIDGLPFDERNAAILAVNRDRPLADIRAEAAGAHARIIRAIEALSDAELNDPNLVPWLEGQPLWHAIAAENTYLHYAHHAANLRAWLGA